MTVRPRINQTAIDARNVRELAEFYRELLGLRYRAGDEPPSDGSPDDHDWLVLVYDDDSRALAFQRNDKLVATTWPSPEVPMQMHVDMTVPDKDSLFAARDRVQALGGRVILDNSDDPEEAIFVFADPAGHPFCVFVA